ncbi:hypothetical protein, partial [Burkholderia ubonensis]|uniref:hypothetical protein n=1 Tax=Burkholderia ubonensis TaxID=101571 RepID=UPI001C433590
SPISPPTSVPLMQQLVRMAYRANKCSVRPYSRRYDRNRQAGNCDALHRAFAVPILDLLGVLLAIAHDDASAHALPGPFHTR